MSVPSTESRRSGERFTTQAPVVDANELARRIERVRAARRESAKRAPAETLDTLRAVVESWLAPDSHWQRLAEALLPEACGFSPEMVRRALPWMLDPLRGDALAELLQRELGMLRPAAAPHMVAQVLSGNLPGLAAIPVASALAIGSGIVVKAASGDRVFPQLLASSIEALDPVLGDCVAAVYFRGGDRACEAILFEAADVTVAQGGDAAIRELRARCPTRFIGHGHRISFAVVASEILSSRAAPTAADLALDVAIWDQRGCLSPQVCFVEGDFKAAREFAELLAEHFERMARALPPGPASVAEDAAVRRFRDEAEWRRIGSQRARIVAPQDSLDWTIVAEPDLRFAPTPLRRSLRLVSFATPDDLRTVLGPARQFLEAAGLAAPDARSTRFTDLLTKAGVHRVCQLGQMQRPSLAWSPGGRPRVADWMGDER